MFNYQAAMPISSLEALLKVRTLLYLLTWRIQKRYYFLKVNGAYFLLIKLECVAFQCLFYLSSDNIRTLMPLSIRNNPL
jgi:hypothetical protein